MHSELDFPSAWLSFGSLGDVAQRNTNPQQRKTMKRYMTHILAIAALVLVSCSKTQPPTQPPPPGLVGRWQQVGTSGELAFHADGTVEIAMAGPGSGVNGKYSLITDTELKIEVKGVPFVYQFALSGDKLTLTDPVEGEKMDYLKAQ